MPNISYLLAFLNRKLITELSDKSCNEFEVLKGFGRFQ